MMSDVYVVHDNVGCQSVQRHVAYILWVKKRFTNVSQWRRQGGRGEAAPPMGGRPKIM